MTTEKVDIQVTGAVKPGVETGIRAIAKAATDAHSAINRMQLLLNSLDSNKLNQMMNGAALAAQKLATEQQKTALGAQKLATEQQKTAQAAANAAAAQMRLNTASVQGAAAQQALATATARTAAAQSAAQAAAARTVSDAQRSASAAAAAQAAADRAATAAAQKLATEQQRTAAAAANAAAAQDRQALSALRLAEAQRRAAEQGERATVSLRQYVAAAASAVGLTVSTQAVLGLADSYVVLQNKLQNVTTSQEQVNKITNEMFALANRTLSGVQETTTAFTRFDRALRYMGKSQEETIRMTETVNKALIIGGATATEASSALLQLSQAFNAGKLQGDEFRSISENMPMVLDAVAKAMDKPISQVKQMSTEGKITAEVMYKAFKLIEKQVDETFSKSTLTLGQGFTVLRNNAMQFFGELNKATGFTTALARGMITLGKNMDVVAVAMAVLGAAMLYYFGPVLLTAINLATAAMWRFTAAVMANPIGLLVVGITAATAAIAIYGDQIKVVENQSITLKDMFRTAWDYIKDAGVWAAEGIAAGWGSLIDVLNEVTNGWAEKFRNLFSLILLNLQNMVNTFVGLFMAMYSAVGVIWDNFPQLAKAAFAKVVNFGADAVEGLTGLFKSGVSAIITQLSAIAPGMAASLQGALDGFKLELPRMEVDKAGADAGSALAQGVVDAFSKDYVGDAVDKFMERAAEKAKARIAEANASANALLRGAGPDTTGAGGDEKGALKRAAALAKVNLQLDNELQRMNMLKPAREIQQRYDQIEEQLAGKKIKLNEEEAASLRKKIETLQAASAVQSQMDSMLESATGAQRTYTAQLAAADLLLKQNAITQQQYNGILAGTKEAYSNAIDPIREYTRAMEFERSLMGQNANQREVSIQLHDVEQSLLQKNIVLTNEQRDALQRQIQTTQQAQQVQAAYNDVYSNTQGRLESIRASASGLQMALQNGTIGMSYYRSEMTALGIEAAKLRVAMDQALPGDEFTASLSQLLDGYRNFASGATEALGGMFASLQDGVANSLAGAIMGTQDLGDALRNVAASAVQEFIAQMIKLGIQYTINQALGIQSATAVGAAQVAASTAATTAAVAGTATQTAASTAAAATTAAAWAPAAIWASIGSFGQAAVIAGGAILAVKALGGFEKGGYTGDYGRQAVAGVVHGGEYVMTADTVNRVGLDQLEAIQRGASVASPSTSGNISMPVSGGGRVTINIVNNVAGAEVTQSQKQNENGDTDINVQINSLENALASRMSSGRGPLHKATRDAFDLQPSTISR